MPLDAPERWAAQDAILREARFYETMGLYTKAARMVKVARELGTLSKEHEESARRIEQRYERYNGRERAA